jgi:putative membrane protein
MRAVFWSCRILIFLFLLAFAIKNTETVNVRFIFDTFWQAPMIIVLLAFFAGGAALGVLSLLGTVFALRREISRLKQTAKNEAKQEPLKQSESPPDASL